LRHAGFTVTEVFAGFDRNGSGAISVSEFCSLLKVILGRAVEKKVIYKIMSSVDIDGEKTISLQEMQLFIYYVWRSELKDVANRALLDTNLDEKSLHSLLKEKDEIKNAIIRNFPRDWRDKVAKLKIESPFTNLFDQGAKMLAYQANSTKSPAFKKFHDRPVSPTMKKATSPTRPKTVAANNSSSLKMYRLHKMNTAIPYREGSVLSSIPKVANINDVSDFISREGINEALGKTI
jgi:hypothetical protein